MYTRRVFGASTQGLLEGVSRAWQRITIVRYGKRGELLALTPTEDEIYSLVVSVLLICLVKVGESER